MNLKNLLKLFAENNCETVLVKRLVRNNNSKQQIYVAQGDTRILNIFPLEDFKSVLKPNAKKETFHAGCEFYWIDDEGHKFLDSKCFVKLATHVDSVDKGPIQQPENYSDVVRMLKRLVAASSEALEKLTKWNRTYKSGRPPRSRNFDGLVARASSQLRDDSQISEAWSAERPQAI